ncbi:copper resistance protein B [Maricaulis salignorans]|uniref:copper resistance protein B n=1 Tax=Maricaulis salignorans TaxID=144026 RepID=UPI003A8FB1D0
MAICRLAAVALLALAILPEAEARQGNPVDADPARMAAARAHLFHGMGTTHSMVLVDRFEHLSGGADDAFLWDAQGWVGGDERKFWFKTEGEYSFDASEFETAQLQALYSRAISPNFDLQFGLRHDFEPGPSTSYAVLGLQGLAPYWFEVDAAAFLSDAGDMTARIEAEYELLITQRLVLQPRAEFHFAAGEIAEHDLGSGLTETEFGLRLRYEIRREFAPYIGIEWHDLQGDTADLARLHGEAASDRVIAVGIRFWF